MVFFFSSRRRHTRCLSDWSSDVCSSDLGMARGQDVAVDYVMLSNESLPALQSALESADLDGWLIYDFHGLNPVAVGMLELSGMTTRRFFVFIPRMGTPVTITHAIEQGPWNSWPATWRKEQYSSWRALESHLAALV